MKIKTGLVIPMMTVMSIRVDKAARAAEPRVSEYVKNYWGVPSHEAVSSMPGDVCLLMYQAVGGPASGLSITAVSDPLDSLFSR